MLLQKSSLVRLKIFLKCWFWKKDLVSVKCTMYAANNEVIKFLHATFDCLFGMKGEGKQTETA